MKDSIKNYIATWWNVIVRPIYFYSFLPKGSWQDEALSFAGYTSWILGFFIAFAVFILLEAPKGLRLIEDSTVKQMIVSSPVLVVFSLAFFIMTLLIVGGVVLALIFGALYMLGVVLHVALNLLGGKGSLSEMLKATLFSGAAFLAFIVPIIFVVTTKYRLTELWQLSTLENMVYYGVYLYLYGLWSIAGKRVHNVPKWKAFLAAALPLAILVLIGVVFHAKVFPRIDKFLV